MRDFFFKWDTQTVQRVEVSGFVPLSVFSSSLCICRYSDTWATTQPWKFWNQCLSLSLVVLMTTCFLYWREKAGESLNGWQILESVQRKNSRRCKDMLSLREAASWGFSCKFLIYKQTGLSQTLIALALTSVSLLLTSSPLFQSPPSHALDLGPPELLLSMLPLWLHSQLQPGPGW